MSYFLSLLTLSFVVTTLMFIGLWVWAQKIDNYSIVDAAWSFTFTLHALLFYFFGSGYGIRRLLILIMLSTWSLRLFRFLFRRIRRHHPIEDDRYQELRARYEPNVRARFFMFYQFQVWSISALTLPLLLVSLNEDPKIHGIEILGFLIWLVAFIGESTADRQKADYYRDPMNRGTVCEIGLWRYSRHPNYFFESFIWWGFFVFALGTPNMFMAIYAPLTMLFLLLKVTGIPISERAQLKKYGIAFEEYQKTTSVFVPWRRLE